MVSKRGPRVAMITSHPLSPPWDSADKQVAALLMRKLHGYRFYSARRAGRAAAWPGGLSIPVMSLHGRPSAATGVQIAAVAAATSVVADLRHLVVTIGPGFPKLVKAVRALDAVHRCPILHTAPGVVDPEAVLRYGAQALELGTTVVPSETTARLLRSAGFSDVRTIRPGLCLEEWPWSPRPEGTQIVLFAGHHDEGGGTNLALEAFAASAPRRTARLVLAMRVRRAQDELAMNAALRRRALSLGLSNVDVLGHVDDMASLIRGASLVILPTSAPTGKADPPIVVLEAMATGRPVIVSGLPGVEELEPAVKIVPPNAGAFSRAIDALLGDDHLWCDHASRGRDLVERQFSDDAAVGAYSEVYRELTESTGQALWRERLT